MIKYTLFGTHETHQLGTFSILEMNGIPLEKWFQTAPFLNWTFFDFKENIEWVNRTYHTVLP